MNAATLKILMGEDNFMTVGELIKQLNTLDPDIEVTVSNESFYMDGQYKVNGIEMYGDDVVIIVVNYNERIADL